MDEIAAAVTRIGGMGTVIKEELVVQVRQGHAAVVAWTVTSYRDH